MKNPQRKEWTQLFRVILPALVIYIAVGQSDIKKTIDDRGNELLTKIERVDSKLDKANEERKLTLQEHNHWQRETEGRISFLEAATGMKKRIRKF